MPSTVQFKDFIIEQLRNMQNIVCRPMMGEYLLYHNGILFGGIYDDRLLIKRTNSNQIYSLPEEIPYEKAKSMYMVDNLDDIDYLSELIQITCNDLRDKENKNG